MAVDSEAVADVEAVADADDVEAVVGDVAATVGDVEGDDRFAEAGDDRV